MEELMDMDMSWRQCSYLGFLQLEPVLDTAQWEEAAGPGGPFAVPDSNPSLKRRGTRDEEGDAPRSNKMRVVEEGAPETLPSFRQNTLLDKDKAIVEKVIAEEKQLRAQVQHVYTFQKGNVAGADTAGLSTLTAAFEQKKHFIAAQLTTNILKPGTLAVLQSFSVAIDELKMVVNVCMAEVRGIHKEMAGITFMEDFYNRPLKQDEPTTVLAKLVRAPNMTGGAPTQLDVTTRALDGTSEMNLEARCSKKPTFTAPDLLEFPAVTVKKASRKKLAVCAFSCRVGQLVVAGLSSPFVVTSNEKQWHEAYGTILQQKIFGDNHDTVPTTLLCNELQSAYIVGTRQHKTDPPRPLSPFDFQYILTQHLPGKTECSRADFDPLWDWFGSIVSRIRHDKAVWDLWTQGFIMGFISKEDSEKLLVTQRPGTFLLRFSSQAPGSFAIAYTGPQGDVSHYLIRKVDANASFSLAKFLLEKPYFSTLLQTVPCFEQQKWQPADKQKALAKWDKKGSDSVPGYDESLNIPFGALKI